MEKPSNADRMTQNGQNSQRAKNLSLNSHTNEAFTEESFQGPEKNMKTENIAIEVSKIDYTKTEPKNNEV